MDTPPNGFKWSKVRTVEAAGSKIRVYSCTKEGDAARAVLTIEERLAQDDKSRITTLKGHYNGMVQSLKTGGFTEIKGDKPDFKPPIKERGSFLLTGKMPREQRHLS